MLDAHADDLERAALELGKFFDHLRQVGFRGFVAENTNDPIFTTLPEFRQAQGDPVSVEEASEGRRWDFRGESARTLVGWRARQGCEYRCARVRGESMRGHIAKKGSRYYVVIYEGVDSSTGKPKRRWHAAGETRAEAEKLLAELVKRVHDGDYRAPDKITVGDYLLHRWLPAEADQAQAHDGGRLRAQHPAAHQPQHRAHPPAEAPARGPRRALREAPERRQAQRPGRRPIGPVCACGAHHHPERPVRRRSQGARSCATSPTWPTRPPPGARNRP